VEPAFARTVVTQVDFYRILLSDMQRARHRIVIYSPFITQGRIAVLEPSIKAAIERGVSFFVITKGLSERDRDVAQYKFLEQTLMSWGCRIIHKLHMHEKLVFLDEDILWSGSLNPLSFSSTQEVMER